MEVRGGGKGCECWWIVRWRGWWGGWLLGRGGGWGGGSGGIEVIAMDAVLGWAVEVVAVVTPNSVFVDVLGSIGFHCVDDGKGWVMCSCDVGWYYNRDRDWQLISSSCPSTSPLHCPYLLFICTSSIALHFNTKNLLRNDIMFNLHVHIRLIVLRGDKFVLWYKRYRVWHVECLLWVQTALFRK